MPDAGGMVRVHVPVAASEPHGWRARVRLRPHCLRLPGPTLSPLPPRKIFNGNTMAIMAYSAESYDTHPADQIETSETDPEFFADDGSDSDQ